MLLLSFFCIDEREDKDFSAHLYHRNDKNVRNSVLFYRFANSITQTAAVLFTFFFIFLIKMKNRFVMMSGSDEPLAVCL